MIDPDALTELLEKVGDAVLRVDAGGLVTSLSPRAEALTGRTAADARGQPVGEVVRLVGREHRTQLEDLVSRALRGEAAARDGTVQVLLIGRGGSEYAVVDAAMPLRGASGKVTGALLVLRGAEDERMRLQSQLVLSERMASMGTLSGGLAHEINNPLASVLANLALLEAELPKLLTDSERTRDLLEAVAEAHRGSERVAQIVRGLKVFSRGLDERRQPLDVARIAEQVLQLLANELRHRARVVRDFQPAPQVEASEAHLGQVFVNLLMNAAQSIPEGDADRNEVRVTVRPGGAGEVVFEVCDTGAGMRPEVLARVFDPFFTTRPVGSGSGLGLSICHGIVTSLEGSIVAESAPGRGSVFRVTLPAAQPAPSIAPPAAAAAPGRRGRILLVEDDPLVARAVKRTLQREHDVVFVEGGREALKALAEGTFDLVISDLMMPEMTGMELHAELLQTRPELAERMVFLSGGAFTDAARDFLRRVPNRQLEKPFDPDQLRTTVRQLLSA